MDQQPRTPGSSPTPAALLMLARELRDAAVIAGRGDVAAKAEEAIRLIMGERDPAGGGVPHRDGDKANVVIRVLDGLGL